jgi:hypothetical protein
MRGTGPWQMIQDYATEKKSFLTDPVDDGHLAFDHAIERLPSRAA